jgi:glycosyltransferase involved in cell wall biosynthesis
LTNGENISKISVVMPVYKGDNHLSEAVDSVLNQTFSDFEFIIICDDPTNETRDILDRYKQEDSRMKIYYQERQGLVNSLNKGISLAKGEYIIRMDADDISLPTRFEKQVEFMDNNPEIGISGTWVKIIGDVPEYILKHPPDHEAIMANMLFFCTIAHPSVIFRREVFHENKLCYDQNETYAEDYGLWIRAADIIRFANIPQVHLCYRLHSSNTNADIQKGVSGKIRLSQIRKLGINPTKAEFEVHEAISNHTFKADKHFILLAKSWLEKLQATNSEKNIYPEPTFSKVLVHYWYDVCCSSIDLGINSWRLFNNSRLCKFANLSIRGKLRLLFKPSIRYLKIRVV